MWEVTILAVLQGIAEFLPISSSGHLVLGRQLLGLGEVGLRLDIFLHLGTLVSIVCFYWMIVWRLLGGLVKGGEARTKSLRYLGLIVLSAIPVAVAGLLFKDQLEAAFATPKLVGGALIFTGLVLTATRFLPKGEKAVGGLSALGMGLAQAIAILPGVSRSGMTLAAARLLRVEAAQSAEFSFLMSAPPILGAALLQLKDLLAAPAAAPAEISWPLTIYGAILAAGVGYFALKLLVRSLKGRWFWLFGPYCLAAGLLTWFLI